jgi:hypothetical protein
MPEEPLKKLPKGTKIKFLSNNFFYGTQVELDEDKDDPNYRGTLTLQIKPNAKLGLIDFPEKIIFEARIPGASRDRYRGSVNMLLCNFVLVI